VDVYVCDLLWHLSRAHSSDVSAVSGSKPALQGWEMSPDPFSLYFSRVARGEHVEDARFSFILATRLNRVCFARLVAARLSHVNGARVMAQGDYLQLLRLLCRDLSSDFVRLIWSLLTSSGGARPVSDSPAPILLPFPQLRRATTGWLVLGECLEDVAKRLCDAGADSPDCPSWWDHSVLGVQEAFAASTAACPTRARPPRWLVERAANESRHGTLRSFFRAILTAEDWSPRV
jgi:hypothetical protein